MIWNKKHLIDFFCLPQNSPFLVLSNDLWKSLELQTGLSVARNQKILNYFWLEIQLAILSGERVVIPSLGRFFLTSPETTNSIKKRHFAFEFSKKLKQAFNAEE